MESAVDAHKFSKLLGMDGVDDPRYFKIVSKVNSRRQKNRALFLENNKILF